MLGAVEVDEESIDGVRRDVGVGLELACRFGGESASDHDVAGVGPRLVGGSEGERFARARNTFDEVDPAATRAELSRHLGLLVAHRRSLSDRDVHDV